MKKNVFTLVLGFSLILLFLSSCAKDEEVLTGTISGFVSDYTNANAPIAGATVTINWGRGKYLCLAKYHR